MPHQNQPAEPAVLTVDETAELLRVSRWLIYAHVDDGTLPFGVFRVASTVRVIKADVDRLLGN